MQFDYYSTSLKTPLTHCLDGLMASFGSQIIQSEPIPRYPEGFMHHETGIRMYSAPDRDPYLVASGSSALKGAEFCRSFAPDHRPSRIDVAYDFDEKGGFDRIADLIVPLCRERRVSVCLFGDPDPNSGKGRTWYLGSRTSDVRVRLYEKGLKEIGEGSSDASANWVRMELQVRPRKDRRVKASIATEQELWGFAQWTREISEMVCQSSVPFVPDLSLRVPDYERAVTFMVHQYSKPMKAFVQARGQSALYRLIDRALSDE